MLPGLWWDGGDPPLDIDFVLGVHGGFSQHVKVDGRQTWGVSSTLKMSEPSWTSSSDRCFSTSCSIGLVWQSIRHHLFRPLQSCPYMSMLFMMCYTHAHWPYFFLIAHPVPGVSRPQAWVSLGNRATSPSRLGRQPDMFPASPHCDQLPPFSHLFRGKSGISLSGRTGSNLPLCLKTWLQTVSGWVSLWSGLDWEKPVPIHVNQQIPPVNKRAHELQSNLVQAIDLKPLNRLLPTEWNPLCRKPLSKWLIHSQTEEDNWKDRVHACGNIVVPCQAAAALQIAARIPISAWVQQAF